MDLKQLSKIQDSNRGPAPRSKYNLPKIKTSDSLETKMSQLAFVKTKLKDESLSKAEQLEALYKQLREVSIQQDNAQADLDNLLRGRGPSGAIQEAKDRNEDLLLQLRDLNNQISELENSFEVYDSGPYTKSRSSYDPKKDQISTPQQKINKTFSESQKKLLERSKVSKSLIKALFKVFNFKQSEEEISKKWINQDTKKLLKSLPLLTKKTADSADEIIYKMLKCIKDSESKVKVIYKDPESGKEVTEEFGGTDEEAQNAAEDFADNLKEGTYRIEKINDATDQAEKAARELVDKGVLDCPVTGHWEYHDDTLFHNGEVCGYVLPDSAVEDIAFEIDKCTD